MFFDQMIGRKSDCLLLLLYNVFIVLMIVSDRILYF